jgi:uncharacterized glyoxalase superfamily protein PhnB
MAKPGKPIPEGYHSITPYLTVKGAAQAIDFYKRAFGAEEIVKMPGPDGKSVMHAELKIGDSIFMLSDEFPGAGCHSPQSLGATTIKMHMYVNDVDAAFDRAVKAGATALMPVADMFWGDRYGKLKDPYGHEWGLATHKLDLTPEEMGKAAQAAFSKMPKQS